MIYGKTEEDNQGERACAHPGAQARNGNRSLYLDIYSKGVRKVESLGVYLVPENTPFDKIQNEHARSVAEKIKSERIIALQNYGIANLDKVMKPRCPFSRILRNTPVRGTA